MALILIVVLVYLYWPVERAYNRAEAEALANAEEDWYIIHCYPEKTSSYYYYFLEDDKRVDISLRGKAPGEELEEVFYTLDDDPTNCFLVHGKLLDAELRKNNLVYILYMDEGYILAPLVRNTKACWFNTLLPRHYICMWDVLLGNYKR